MKIEITTTGWKEITTREIKIIGNKWDNPTFAHQTTKEWIESNKRVGLSKKRLKCNCCGRPWEDLPGRINFFSTNKGNKAICDECFKKIFGGEQ